MFLILAERSSSQKGVFRGEELGVDPLGYAGEEQEAFTAGSRLNSKPGL